MREEESVQNEVRINVNLHVALHLDGDTWVGYCPILDLASQGDTEESALVAVKEVIELWFESCLERGVLGKALEESGFQRVIHIGSVPVGVQDVAIEQPRIPALTNSEKNTQVTIELPAYIAAAMIGQLSHAPH